MCVDTQKSIMKSIEYLYRLYSYSHKSIFKQKQNDCNYDSNIANSEYKHYKIKAVLQPCNVTKAYI